MKFVIKSLLFVSLLLQMTNALRKCFNQDQNLMLTIILLAFSLIGIIGLTVGNRFILIIFAACMTLILIASITIYAIGRTEPDASKPKVPYFTNTLQSEVANPERGNRVKSLVNKLLNRNQQQQTDAATKLTNKKSPRKYPDRSRPAPSSADPATELPAVTRSSRTHLVANSRGTPSAPLVAAPQSIEDYSDEATGVVHLLLSPQAEIPIARSGLDDTKAPQLVVDSSAIKTILEPPARKQPAAQEVPAQDPESETNMIQSQQWIAYERHLYERYLEIVSQSIDLIMLTILASWMALLLDEESDQCFGTSKGRVHSSQAPKQEAPIYNYNGVRYSIKPGDEAADSPSRVVVR